MRPWARVRTAWVMLTGTGAAAGVASGLLVFVSVFACLVIPRENAALRTGALERTLTASPPSDRGVIGTVGLTDLAASAEVAPADISAFGGHLASQLAARGVPLASEPPAWSSVDTGYTPVTGAAAAAGGSRAQVQVMYRSALAGYSRVVAGRLPAGASLAGGHEVVQAAVTTATAARFGLRVGTSLTVGRAVRLVVTGIIRPEHPATSFWTETAGAAAPIMTRGTSGSSYWAGMVFVGPGALRLVESFLNPEYMQVTWGFPVAVSRLTANQVSPLRAGLDGMTSSGVVITGESGPVVVTVASQLPAILAPFIAAERAVAPLLGLLYVSLAVTAAVVVLLGAWLVAEHRHAEFALMRARGAALRQVGWLALRGSAVVAVVAVAAAAALASRLTPGNDSQVSLWLAAVTAGVSLAGPVLITAVRHRAPGPGTGRRASGRAGRPVRRRSGARRIVIEVALVAVAVGGLLVLRVQGLSAGGTNFYPSAAPVLVAVPAAIIVLRGYPAVARELARITGRSRGVVAFVGLARATRTSPGAALPAFALVLALTMVTFAAMVSAAVNRGQVDASWRQVGADAIVKAPAGHPITAALQHQIASVPGVTSTATGVVYDALLTASGTELAAVFVRPASYAAAVDQAPGPRFPLAALSGNGAGRPGGIIPAVATPGAAQPVGSAPAQLSLVGSTQNLTMRLAGRISRAPGIAGNPVVVMPLQALGRSPPGPNLMLVAGPRLDGKRLSAIVARELPGGAVTLRATALAALTGAPVPRAAQVTLVQAAATAAGFGVLVLLLSLVLGARSRDLMLARLAAMGLGQRQAQLLLAVEALPQVAAAAIGGIACALALAPLVGPAIDLSVFTGPGPSVVVAPDPVALVTSAAGLILAALLALAAQAAITYRRGSTGALRITE
jgi:putative ABC transport system permease protein